MPPRCPTLSPYAIVSDDAQLAGSLSTALARAGEYLCVLDGPRMQRDDAEAEVTRRNNALARSGARRFILAGLADGALHAMRDRLPARKTAVTTTREIVTLARSAGRDGGQVLHWSSDCVGLGVLTALRTGKLVVFGDHPSPAAAVPSLSGHMVVCEAGEPLSEVIAANYAHALGAGLTIIPETNKVERSKLLEAFYSLDAPGVDAPAERVRLKARLRELAGDIDLLEGGSATFVTRGLPFGAAFPERPSTHLFSYPDLGIAIINGFAAEQRGTRGTNVAVLVDPEKVRAPEIEAAAQLLPKRRVFVRGYTGAGATVRAVSEMVDLFPYDLLVFATHCGDAPGWRETFEFRDSEGLDRTLVTDIAIGVGQTDDPDMLRVMKYIRFHALDGVDWNDPVAKANLYVGTAMRDWSDLERGDALKPTERERIGRVLGSSAMAMSDDNYPPMPRSLAAEGTPIIINNACVSWHELAARFIFSNARAYIGTLFPVSDAEAEEVAVRLLGKHFGRPLPHALWKAQDEVYGAGGDRRPYVMTGVYTQRLRSTLEDAPRGILDELDRGRRHWSDRAAAFREADEKGLKDIQEIATFYEREHAAFARRWFGRDGQDGGAKPS